MVEDPVLDLPEFKGQFVIGVHSDLFKRCIIDGSYEADEARICSDLVDPDRDAIDVGANIGFFTVLLSQLVNSGQRVLAIEPTDGALHRLRANIVRNGVLKKVLLFEGVASSESGTTTINIIEGKEEYSSVGKIVHPSVEGLAHTETVVESSTLDALSARFQLDPGFVKVDAEGWEKAVFEGARGILRDHRPIVLSELDDQLLRQNGSSFGDVVDFFYDLEYAVLDPLTRTKWSTRRPAGTVLMMPKESI